MEEMTEVLRQMRKEKIEQAENHLARLEGLQKAQGDISCLCESVRELAEIDSLRSKLILEVEEKLELCGKVWALEVGVRDRERVVDELKAEGGGYEQTHPGILGEPKKCAPSWGGGTT